MRKLGKSRKIGISVVVACGMLLTILFSSDIKNLFAAAANAVWSALTGTSETTDTSNTIVMRTDDAYNAYEADGYYAFSVYAPSTATYTIGVTAENGSMRVNTGEATAVNEEMSVSLTEGTNVLYIMDCSEPSIQWNREVCDLEPINEVCALVVGDLDQDGERTLVELIRLKKEAKLEGTLTSEQLARKEIADIDRDDSITDEDARLLRELLVGNPRHEASELRPVIVDAYLAETGMLYDSLADAVAKASEISVANSKEVAVTVVNPTDVSMATRIDVDGGAQIILQDDGATDNGWCRTITRTSTLKDEMFAVGNGTLTLAGGSDSDENISLILDGGAVSASSNHFVDVGNRIKDEAATLNMNAGVKLHNNVNTNNGGALAIQTTFNMNGGIISGNLSKGVGGAIILLGAYNKEGVTLPASTMTMAGGIITENESTEELYSSGGVSISSGAKLNMTGGEIYNNITPVSLDNNSVRKSGTSSVFTMGGSAYVDRVCFDTTGVNTHCVELTSKLTTTKDITLFFTQPLNEANSVVKRDSSLSECDALFKLSERMVPCQLVQDDSNENLCLRSDVTDMETAVVGEEPVYSSNSDNAFQALGISGANWTVQGVCADDQYLYMAITEKSNAGCRILKVELGTWEYVDCGNLLSTDHSNEMTYNPNTGRIYITHCTSSGVGVTTAKQGPYAISIVDPNNIDEVEDVIYLADSSAYTGTTGISALAYNAAQDYYVATGTGFRVGFLKGATGEDGTYSITETTMPSTGLKGFTGYTAYTKQGVYATDTTIYTNTWYDIANVTSEEQNFLTIYDWSGNYHGTQYIVNKDGSAFTKEIESLFEYNGTMYMACFPKDYSVVAEVYALSDVGKAESTIEVQDSNGAVVDGVYTNLASAIEKANELGTATLILKEDVTVGAKQTITGNVTIKDDGTPRTIKRGAAYKGQMFVTDSSSASLTLQATGTDKDNPTLILDGNGVQNCYAMISLERSSGTLTVTGPVKFTNAHINYYNGGIIRTVSGAANITIDGAIFTGNTVVTETVNGGLINVLGTSKVTIKDTEFDNNVISSSGAVKGAILYVKGGTANVVDSAFTSNKTTTTEPGGGLIRIDSGTLNIGKYTDEDGVTVVEGACTFTDNSFTASEAEKVYGGVIAIGDDASAQVYNSTFTSNTAELGNISLNDGATLTIGDSELSNNLTTSTTEPDSKDIRATGTSGGKVIFEGKVKTTVYCNNSNKLQIGSQLEAGSEITITGRAAVIDSGNTLVSFTGDNAADVMADCKANGYLKVASEDYILVYNTTDNVAKLASVVATLGEEKYASLADAIEAANALDSATIVLKADVTFGETQTITGNVTITDDGTARTITREGFTDQMFVVADNAGLTFTATGEDKTSPTLTLDGNGEVAGPSGAMVSLGSGSGTLAVNHAVQFTNANINEDGGIIRTGTAEEAVSNAKVTINGGVFAYNTVAATDETYNLAESTQVGDVYGGLINVAGSAEVTISNAQFEYNEISSAAGLVKGGILYVEGGTVNIVGSTFASNTSTTKSAGGGLLRIDSGTLNIGKYVNAAGDTIEKDCYFTDNTFTGSGSNVYGGVIALGNNASAQVYNSTFSSNTAELGNISINNGATLTIGDSELNNLTTSTEEPDSKDIRVGGGGTVIFEGKVNTTVHCVKANSLKVNSQLTEDSQIRVVMASWTEGNTVATFGSDEIMADCKANGYLVLANADYALNYATSGSTHSAKLASTVATIGEQRYASLADAIEAANTLDSAIIVLKADVTVGTTQTITGNVTITDDETARKITREEGFTDQMFVVADNAGLTFAATSEDKTSPTLTIDGNGEVVGASGAMISLESGSGTLAVNHAVKFTNANINEDGGIIRTEDESTATVTINGGVFDNNTAEVDGEINGGLINVLGMANVTISNALFQNNTISSTVVKGGIIYLNNGTLNVVGSNFASNTANTTNAGAGGVVAAYGGTLNIGEYVNAANETIEGDCYFTDNTFTGNSYGGAIAISDTSAIVSIYNTTIQRNVAKNGGGVHMGTGTSLTIGDCTVTDNTTTNNGSARLDINNNGTVNLEGMMKATIFCSNANSLHVVDELETESEIKVGLLNHPVGKTVLTFESAEVMAVSQAYIIYAKYAATGYTEHTEYILSYETTSDSQYIAKLANVVATIGEQKYASLADAITAANALETTAETPATIVLKADVTVDAMQAITGNVTITDDGTAKTLTRGAECTAQMFDVQEGASLTFAGTGTLAEDSSTVQGTITVDGNKTNVTATESMIVNAGTFSLDTNASLTNAGNADVAYGGALYNTGTVALAGTLSDNEGGRGGAVYNSSGTVTFSGGEYSGNTASVHGAVIMSVKGTVEITGGTFTGNTAEDRGGVILSNNAEVTISGGEFSENVANGTTGGGVFGGTSTAVLTITDGNFHDNQASNEAAGGGVIESGGTVTIAGGTFTSNTATKGGVMISKKTATISGGTFETNSASRGGVVYTAIGATLNITGGNFGTESKGNTSTYRAGVVYVEEATSTTKIASATIKNATFSYNSSYNSNATSGGALYVGKYANVEIDGCTFSNNSATCSNSSTTTYAGAIYMDTATVEINNSSFSSCSATRGGALYMNSATGNKLTLHNCNFADNDASFGRDVFYDRGELTLSGKIGNARIDKRLDIINVVGELDPTSVIEIMQISGDGANDRVQVQFDSANATEIGAQCISYYKYYSTVNSGLTLQFDTETYQAIMK